MERDLFFIALESRTKTKCCISIFQLDRTFLVLLWPSSRNKLPWEVVSTPFPDCAKTVAGDHREYVSLNGRQVQEL